MKKETYEKLGAKKFKKLVFKAEKLKWKFIKKFIPHYTKILENQFSKQRDKQLKKAKTEEERIQIINKYKSNVMLMKKEYNTEQNLNYHMDVNKPDEIKSYLERNKNIHKMWLKIDAILAAVLASCIALGNTWAIPAIVVVALEAIKNFECINLQNYGLVCLEEKRERIEQFSNRQLERSRKKYGEAQDVITKTIIESDTVPEIDKVISESTSKESLEQLKQLLLQEQANRNRINQEKGKVKVRRKETWDQSRQYTQQ